MLARVTATLLALCAVFYSCCVMERSRLLIDVDLAGCDAAACATYGELFVIRGELLSRGCLLARVGVDDPIGVDRTFEALAIDDESVVSLVLVMYCGGRCSRCIGAAEGVRAVDGASITLRPLSVDGCFERGTLFGAAPTPCPGPPPDAAPPAPEVSVVDAAPDSSPDEQGVTPDGQPGDTVVADDASRRSCGAMLGCAKKCRDRGCISRCFVDGCPSARAAGAKLDGCLGAHCGAFCSQGVSAPCELCLAFLCTISYATCRGNQC